MANPKPVKIRDFAGLQTNIDSHDRAPGGSEKQVNATCVVRGQLKVRKGLRRVKWDN